MTDPVKALVEAAVAIEDQKMDCYQYGNTSAAQSGAAPALTPEEYVRAGILALRDYYQGVPQLRGTLIRAAENLDLVAIARAAEKAKR